MKAEYEICEFLAKNRGQVFSKEQILKRSLALTMRVMMYYNHAYQKYKEQNLRIMIIHR